MTRERGRSSAATAFVLAMALGMALIAAAPPSASFTTATYERSERIDVVRDADAVVGLQKAATVQQSTNATLVTVTNDAGRDLTLTVALDDPTQGTLRVDTDGDGAYEIQGTSVTFGLLDGASQTVDLEATDTPNSLVSYDITATGSGIDVTAPNRVTEVTNGGGGTPGPCDNQNPPPWC